MRTFNLGWASAFYSVSFVGSLVPGAYDNYVYITDTTAKKVRIDVWDWHTGNRNEYGRLARLYFTVQDTGMFVLDSTRFLFTSLYFTGVLAESWTPYFAKGRRFIQQSGLPGDVDADGLASDMIDIVYLINYVLWSGTPPLVLNSADVDQSCVIDILDIVYLINYVYWGDPPPLRGCVP